MDLPLKYEEIIQILPHRYPFLLVDKIIELELNKRVVGVKNVTINEPFFEGHFPDNPIMPGVLLVEAMAQTGGILARLSIAHNGEHNANAGVFFLSIDKVKFRKPVGPGDQLVLEIEPVRTGSKIWKMAGKSFVDGNLVTQAEFMATIG